MCGLHQKTSCVDYFKSLKILTLPALYVFCLMSFVKNNFNLFESQNGRNGRILKGVRVHYEGFRNSPRYRAISMFNSLDRELRDEPNLNVFKSKLKNMLLTTAPYSVGDVF